MSPRHAPDIERTMAVAGRPLAVWTTSPLPRVAPAPRMVRPRIGGTREARQRWWRQQVALASAAGRRASWRTGLLMDAWALIAVSAAAFLTATFRGPDAAEPILLVAGVLGLSVVIGATFGAVSMVRSYRYVVLGRGRRR